MSQKTKAHVSINLSDVVKHGGVEQAILAWASESDDTSSGVIGSSFSCSGPGIGWQKNHDASCYAERALDAGYGALYYLDETDGRLASMTDVETEYAIVDASGEYLSTGERSPASDEALTWDSESEADEYLEDGYEGERETDRVVCLSQPEVEWSDESVVELVCPDVDDALENPEQVAEMAEAVIQYHGPMSDKAEWKKLIESIKDAAEALSDVDADDLD